jgi:hypothetical protein
VPLATRHSGRAESRQGPVQSLCSSSSCEERGGTGKLAGAVGGVFFFPNGGTKQKLPKDTRFPCLGLSGKGRRAPGSLQLGGCAD